MLPWNRRPIKMWHWRSCMSGSGQRRKNSLAEAAKGPGEAGPPVRAIAQGNGKVAFKALEPGEATKPPINERQITLAVTSSDGQSKRVKVWAAPAAERLLAEKKIKPP
jgi:hypothetical protein